MPDSGSPLLRGRTLSTTIYAYLRGGLPVLSEERIVNNDLVRVTGMGEVFRYDDVADAVKKALLS